MSTRAHRWTRSSRTRSTTFSEDDPRSAVHGSRSRAASPVPDQIATWLTDHPLGELLKAAQDALMESIGAASIEAYGDSVVASVKAAVATWTNAEAAAVVTPRLGSFERWDAPCIRSGEPMTSVSTTSSSRADEPAGCAPACSGRRRRDDLLRREDQGGCLQPLRRVLRAVVARERLSLGRLDAAERLLRLLLEGRTDDQIKGRAAELFKAICEEELDEPALDRRHLRSCGETNRLHVRGRAAVLAAPRRAPARSR